MRIFYEINTYQGSLILSFYRNKKIAVIFNIFEILKSTACKKLFTSLLFIFSSFVATNIFAAAGDNITSTATVSYSFGGVPSLSNATVTFIEDRKINFLVTESDGGSAVPVISSMTNAVMQFTVTNTGNAVHDFLVTAVNTTPNPFATPADNFDPLPVQLYKVCNACFNFSYVKK